jgi:hypothetical protein
MITSKPVELGKASEETKESGHGAGDSILHPFTDPLT